VIRSTVPAVALVLSVAGCGDDGSAGSPADAVRSYNAAVADGDGERACERLDDTAQKELRESAQGAIRGSCAKVVEALAAFYDETTKERLRDAKVKAEPQGARATATFRAPAALGSPAREQTYELRRVDDEWKIASLGLTPEGTLAP
jgi:hypothetical protein